MKYTNTNLQTVDTSATWDGKTGSDVLDIISQALDNTITDITFDTEHATGSSVPYTVTKGDGTTKSDTITVMPASSYTIDLEFSSTVPSFIGENEDISLDYTYAFLDGGTNIKNVVSQFNITINGTTLDLAEKTPASYTTGTRPGTLVLKSSYFKKGSNTLSVTCSSTYGGSSTIAETRIDENVYLTELDLDVTVLGDVDDAYSVAKSSTDSFTFIPSLTNYATFPAELKTNMKINMWLDDTSNEAFVKDATYTSSYSKTFTEMFGASKTYSEGQHFVFIQASATNTNNKTVKSNIIMFLVNALSEDGTLTNGPYLSTKLSLAAFPNPNINLTVNQYNILDFKFYINTIESTNISINNNSQPITQTTSTVTRHLIDYPINFTDLGEQTLTVSCGSTTLLQLIINVTESNVAFKLPTTNRLVSLSANGLLSGNRTWAYGDYSTEFTDFDWTGNGWVDGGLLFNANAKAIINCPICKYSSYTASFKFKVENCINDSEVLISCLTGSEANKNAFGFKILPEKLICYPATGDPLTCQFSSGDEHEITIVKYASGYKNLYIIYIDGCIQKVTLTTTTKTSDEYITITANEDQLYLYNVDLYNTALSFIEVQSLYGFHKSTLSEIQDYFDKNSIYDEDESVNLLGYHGNCITPDTLPIGSNYMIIKAQDGGLEKPWVTINELDGSTQEIADANKGIRYMVGSIKYIQKTESGSDPHNFYAVKASLSGQGTSSMGYPIKNFRFYFNKGIDSSDPYYNAEGLGGDEGKTTDLYTNIPEDFDPGKSYTDVTHLLYDPKTDTGDSIKYAMYTSDDGYSYPSPGAKLFCLKADFAESSGTHNTGFARFAHSYLSSGTNIVDSNYTDFQHDGNSAKLPQERYRGTYKYDIRTTIDGKPIYLFFETADGSITYHGKYNMNNEKKTTEVFGFTGNDTYYNNDVVKTEASLLETQFGNVYTANKAAGLATSPVRGNNNENYFQQTHQTYNLKDGKYKSADAAKGEIGSYINPNECWEFSNNTFTTTNLSETVNNVGAFQYPYPLTSSYPKYSEYSGYNPFTAKYNDKLIWLNQAWEYRFPEWETDTTKMKQEVAHTLYNTGVVRPFLLESLYKWIYKHNVTLWDSTSKLTKANEFAYQLSYYFNVNYLLKYYMLTKFFACVDQRVKNCMFAFFCDPDADSTTTDIDPQSPMGHMRCFPIFYDNDTILGLGNDGSMKWDWNVDESDAFAGYGIDGLWDTIEYCYNIYQQIEKGDLTLQSTNKYCYQLGKCLTNAYQDLAPYLLNNESGNTVYKYIESLCNAFPDFAYNLDGQIKYFYPEKLNTKVTLLTDNLPKEQGNRKPHRLNWLKKRKIWFDNKFKGGTYNQYLYAFKPSGTGNTYATNSLIIKVKSALDNFRFYTSTGKVTLVTPLLTANEETQIQLPAGSISDFINIQGLYTCTSLDFSGCQFTKDCYISATDPMNTGSALPYLLTLILNSNDNDYLQYIASGILQNLVNPSIIPNLTKLVIAKCSTDTDGRFSDTLNCSKFSLLKEIDSRNTLINEIKLPDSSILTTLYLQSPESIELTNKKNLTKISISDKSNLDSVILGSNNNIIVYDTIVPLCGNIQDNLSTFSIAFSTDENNPDEVGDNTITALINTINSTDNISGYIYNANISDTDVLALLTKFKKLHVTNVPTGEIKIITSTNKLSEGESIILGLTQAIPQSNWSIKLDGSDFDASSDNNNLQGKLHLNYETIEVEENGSTVTKTSGLTITADSSESLQEISATLVVTVKGNNDTTASKTIYISYVPITSLSLETWDNNDIIVDKDTPIRLYMSTDTIPEDASNYIKVTPNENTTKKINVTDLTINGVTGVESVTMGSEDLTITVAYNTTTPVKIIVYYNTILGSYSELEGSDQTKWIIEILKKVYPSTYESYKQLNITRNITSKIAASTYFISNNITYTVDSSFLTLDLSYLQYFKWIGEFLIPSWCWWNKISIPDTVDTVTWSSIATECLAYGTILMPRNLNTAKISLSGLKTQLKSCQIDLSKTSITKIYNAGSGSPDKKSMSISLTYQDPEDTTAGTYDLTTANLFVNLPNTITQIGTCITNAENDTVATTSLAMFNISGLDLGDKAIGRRVAITTIPAVTGQVTLGTIFGYPTSQADVILNQLESGYVSNILNIYGTIQHLNGTTSNQSINLNGVENIGSFSFYNPDLTSNASISQVNLNSEIKSIGYKAFGSFNFNLLTSSTDTLSISGTTLYQLTDINTISTQAFYAAQTGVNLIIKSNNISIGSLAFAGDTVDHTIVLAPTSETAAISVSSDSFGDKDSSITHKVLLYLNSYAYDILSANTTLYNVLSKRTNITLI